MSDEVLTIKQGAAVLEPAQKTTGVEWIGGTVAMRAYVTGEGEPYRPEVLFWMGADGAVLGSTVAKPGELFPMASESLRSTIEQPIYGRPHRPTRVRVASAELAETLRDGHPGLDVVCAPTPELNEMLALMRQKMGADGPTEQQHRGTKNPAPPELQSTTDRTFQSIDEIVQAAKRPGGPKTMPTAKRRRSRPVNGEGPQLPGLSALVADATSEDARLRALSASIRDSLQLPVDGFVVGEPIEVVAIDYDGSPRRGLTATCRHRNELHTVSLADVSFSSGQAAAAVALYRQWLGLETKAEPPTSTARSKRRHKAEQDDIELGHPTDLIVLACKSNALRCRIPGTERELTLRTAVGDEVPGEIITVIPARKWTHARHPYLSGAVEASRLDVQALGLPPLELRPEGDWDPKDEYWGEEGEPIDEWAEPIIARGKRPAFELEQVIPGADPEDFDSDPIVEAGYLRAAGLHAEARELLMRLLGEDLRCLDAHAHLGNWEFDHRPEQALRHYAAGVGIGALALATDFDGVLPWGLIDNRPFLRCMHGLGISWWKLGHTREAVGAFRRMLWLNPSDNQGARFNLAALASGRTWQEMEEADA